MKIQKINYGLSVGNTANNDKRKISNPIQTPSFGKTIDEHRSWGARINPKTKDVNFKIFTYPDAQSVSAVINNNVEIKLENKGEGVFEKQGVSKKLASDGDRYFYRITKADGNTEEVKDPYSFKQDELSGPSTLYDHSKYNWKYDEEWKYNKDRIKSNSNGKDGYKSVLESRIYALSPDTITDKRSYDGVKSKLKDIKNSGFNTIEVMHIENTNSFNWGYDGVDKSAPSSYLGGPDALKGLVDEAHKQGLNVVFDIVPNHIGPDGNQLCRTGNYIKGPNDFGDAFNYEGEHSEHVRDYIINSVMNWVDNYHVDGLRLDMTKYMESDYTLRELAADLNYHFPDCYIIAEDSRSQVGIDWNGNPIWNDNREFHDKRVTTRLTPEDFGKGKSQEEHAQITKHIFGNPDSLKRLGMNSEWDFNYYHKLDDMFYNPTNVHDFMEAILQSQDAVKYVMSHDEIGNHEGTRKIAKTMVPDLGLNGKIELDGKDRKRAMKYAQSKHMDLNQAMYIVSCQKEQLVSEDIATKFQTGELDEYKTTPDMTREEVQQINKRLQKEVLDSLGIPEDLNITYSKVERAFNKSYSKFKAGTALTFGIPGPKMVFQGDESADLTPFRFFRRFESVPNETYLYDEKGYEPAESALEASTMGEIPYSKEGRAKMNKFKSLVKDLNKLNEENKALTLGRIQTHTIADYKDKGVLGFESKCDDNEIYTIVNFENSNYDNSVGFILPEGKWVEVINTDDAKYGGKGTYLNTNVINSDGHSYNNIKLGAYSTVYFKKVA